MAASGLDAWCHHIDNKLLVQLWLTSDAASSKPALVFQFNLGTEDAEGFFIVNAARVQDGLRIWESVNPSGFMKLMDPEKPVEPHRVRELTFDLPGMRGSSMGM